MTDEIERAMQRYHDRKVASQIDPNVVSEEAQIRLALSGTDLDFDALMDKKEEMVNVARDGYANGVPIAEVVWGMWVDGLVTGIEVEKGRTPQ